MKVILLKDVPKVGKKYEIKQIADGYAINLLIPKNLAMVANDSNIKKINILKASDTESIRLKEEALLNSLNKIENIFITIKAKSNEKGNLFASIHKEQIEEELKKQKNVDLDSSFIILPEPIKKIGDYEIEVKVADKKTKFKLSVIS